MTIDVHTHLAPVLDHPIGGAPGLYDANRLVRALADNAIDRAWVSAPPPFYRQHQNPEETRRWVRAIDEGLRVRLDRHDTLDRLTYLPFDQPDIALELLKDVDDSVGWTASAGGGSLALDDPGLEPIWAAMNKPLLLHPGESPDTRLDRHYLSNLLGNPVETGIAAAQLVLGGVLTRHPDLKIVLVHCGGVVPAVVGRWSRGVATHRPGRAPDTEDPLSADHLLIGSDYPFPMGLDNPFDAIAHLPAELRHQIAGNTISTSRRAG